MDRASSLPSGPLFSHLETTLQHVSQQKRQEQGRSWSCISKETMKVLLKLAAAGSSLLAAAQATAQAAPQVFAAFVQMVSKVGAAVGPAFNGFFWALAIPYAYQAFKQIPKMISILRSTELTSLQKVKRLGVEALLFIRHISFAIAGVFGTLAALVQQGLIALKTPLTVLTKFAWIGWLIGSCISFAESMYALLKAWREGRTNDAVQHGLDALVHLCWVALSALTLFGGSVATAGILPGVLFGAALLINVIKQIYSYHNSKAKETLEKEFTEAFRALTIKFPPISQQAAHVQESVFVHRPLFAPLQPMLKARRLRAV